MISSIFSLKNLFTILFFLIALLYVCFSGMNVFMIQDLNEIMTAAHSPAYSIIAFFPYLPFFPLIFMIAAFAFFHISLKIRGMSPLSFILAVLFLIILPYPLFRVFTYSINPIVNQFNYSLFHNTFEKWNNVIVLLSIVTAVALMLSVKRFNKEGNPLEKKFRRLLGIFIIMISVPILCFSAFVFYKGYNTDSRYESVSKQVTFYVYRPEYIPENRIHETVYFVNKNGIVSGQQTIQVDFNFPLNELINGRKSGLISIKQSGINNSFNLNSFADGYRANIRSVKKISLKQASSSEGILKSHENSHYLLFKSKKNTLIVISAFYIDEKELVKFADSLR